ncbi:MAG: PIN domain-containing protein [Gammaproteobacteria bacterium]
MELTLKEIRARIVAKEITAISLDTTAFERSRLDLESGLLLRLRQFKGSRVRLVLSTVVASEVQAHLLKAANDAYTSLGKAISELAKGWRVSRERGEELHTLITGGQTPDGMAAERWGQFISRSGAIVMSASEHGDADDVLRRYFTVQPPFESTDKKKHEFPDAIALVGLERWALANDTQVLVVSGDSGWKNFCNTSERLVAVDNLGNALDSFQDDVARMLCKDLSESLAKGDPLGIAATIQRAVKEQHSSIGIDVEANSQFFVEEDGLEFEIESIQIMDASDGNALSAIDYDGKILEAEVRIAAQARGSVTFSFSKWDSIDKVYDSMGSTTLEFTEPLELEAIMTFERDKKGNLKIQRVEVESREVTLSYGDLEPDWMSDGPEPDDPR